jgi:hypothetical protein
MKKILFKKIIATSILSLFFLQFFYTAFLEPTLAVAATASDSVLVTLNVDAGISISAGADVTMPALTTAINASVGTSSWLVKTNNAIGYKLDVKASASPALVSGANSFADYTEASAGVPETWSVASSAKEFGFSAYGTDVTSGTWGAAGTCGTGATIPGMKYVGFKTTDKTIVSTSVPTPYAGTTTNICFAAEQNTVYAPSGTYTATITATATTL